MFPVGKYKTIQHLGLEWAQLEGHLGDMGMLGTKWPVLASGQPSGYIRVAARVAFESSPMASVAAAR